MLGIRRSLDFRRNGANWTDVDISNKFHFYMKYACYLCFVNVWLGRVFLDPFWSTHVYKSDLSSCLYFPQSFETGHCGGRVVWDVAMGKPGSKPAPPSQWILLPISITLIDFSPVTQDHFSGGARLTSIAPIKVSSYADKTIATKGFKMACQFKRDIDLCFLHDSTHIYRHPRWTRRRISTSAVVWK